MFLGLGGVMLVPAFATAQEEQNQAAEQAPAQAGQEQKQAAQAPTMAPGSTTTITKEGSTTTTVTQPGQTTTTTTDANGVSTSKTMKTPAGATATTVTKTVVPTPVVAKLVPIYFQTSSDKVEPISGPLLDATAASIKNNPAVKVVEINGHADARGDAAYNQDLTDRRAKAVSQALQDRGVAADRMQTRGLSDSKPVCSADDADCWSQNRRVDILPRTGDNAGAQENAPEQEQGE
jgi:outer membrane protein OmpA-like peptidoglycan-associated protein